MAQVDVNFDLKKHYYDSIFGTESDVIEEVFGASDDDMEDSMVEESKIQKQEKAYDNFSESRLEAAAKKLRDQYKSLENAKRQRKIQVLENTPMFFRLQKPKKIISRRHPKLETRLRRLKI
ncbi:uncharacterized protein LOC113340240 [Papaver somniferum]|uniref:uncharacterized protein LOC113340240 n=1 Tax=Papaver somniferum TaxID=3469 RepID=UPI000E6F70B8|nr:uncharacterized protein LOC113340240 [Papaver somniferum]